MKNGKTAGLDELSCEHVKFSHPIIVSILSKMFNFFIKTNHIRASFSARFRNVMLRFALCQLVTLKESVSVQ